MASVENAERWRLASAQLASTGHPYDAVRFAIAGVAGATDLRRVFDATMAGQALRDTGFGQRALLLLQGQYIADKSLLFGSGKRLLTISSEHYGRLWDIDRGIRLVDLGKISEWVVSDDETRLVVKSDHDQLVIYDAQSGSQIAQLSGPNSAPEFQFSKKFKFIVTRSSQRQCVLWDATDGRLVSALTPPRGCNAIGGLKDAPLVNIRRPDRTGFIATGAGKVVGNLPFCEYCAISKNGKVAYAFRDNIGSFVEAGTARVISRVRLSGGLAEIEFDDTGDRVAILDQSGLLTLWDTRRGKQVREIGPTDSKYWHVSASHKHVFVTPDDDSAEVWRMQDGVKLISFPPGAGRGLWSSKDGSLIASTGKRGAIYDGVGGVLLSSLPPEGRKIQSITLSDDDRRAVVSSDGAPGYIWDVQGKRKVSEFRDQDEDLGDQGVFSGDSRRYATGGVGGQSNLWDAVTGTYLARLAGEEGATTLQLSRDGMRAVTTTSYSEAAVWDLSNPPGDLDQTSLRARACVLNYQAIGTFSAAERGAHGLSGRPWHPCDWRGLQSIEGWAQLARRWAYRLGLDHDYRCADVTAGGRQTASSLATCYQSTDSNQTASPRLSSMVQLKSDDGSPIVWFERLW